MFHDRRDRSRSLSKSRSRKTSRGGLLALLPSHKAHDRRDRSRSRSKSRSREPSRGESSRSQSMSLPSRKDHDRHDCSRSPSRSVHRRGESESSRSHTEPSRHHERRRSRDMQQNNHNFANATNVRIRNAIITSVVQNHPNNTQEPYVAPNETSLGVNVHAIQNAIFDLALKNMVSIIGIIMETDRGHRMVESFATWYNVNCVRGNNKGIRATALGAWSLDAAIKCILHNYTIVKQRIPDLRPGDEYMYEQVLEIRNARTPMNSVLMTLIYNLERIIFLGRGGPGDLAELRQLERIVTHSIAEEVKNDTGPQITDVTATLNMLATRREERWQRFQC